MSLNNIEYLKGYYRLNGSAKDFSGYGNDGIFDGDNVITKNSIGKQISLFGPSVWDTVIEPIYGLNSTIANVYMEIDDFITNSNTMAIELDYLPASTLTTYKTHGIYSDGLMLGGELGVGQFGFGIGDTGQRVAGMSSGIRYKLKVDANDGGMYVDDARVGTHSNPQDITGCTRNFVLWKAVSNTGNSLLNCYAVIYALRAWDDGVLIHQLLAVPVGETLYNATTPAPTKCFWDTVGQRYYEASANTLTIVSV